MFKFNKKNDNTNSSRELHIPARDIDVSLTAEDVWKNLMRVKTFLSAYNNKYGTNTSK